MPADTYKPWPVQYAGNLIGSLVNLVEKSCQKHECPKHDVPNNSAHGQKPDDREPESVSHK